MTTFRYQAPESITDKTESAPHRILLVDDDSEVAMLVKQVLELYGYHVTVETDACCAIDMVRSAPDSFDLIITDENMPQMQGAQLLKEITSFLPDLPVVLMSGLGNETNEHNYRRKGFAGFIMKPPVFKDLEALVSKVLNPQTL